MGNLLNISNKSYEPIQINSKKPVINPIFKNNIILFKNYKYLEMMNKNMDCYELYQLKNIKDAFYIAFTNINNFLEIHKYNISSNNHYNIVILKTENPAIKIKYFYDNIKSKEYLFILSKEAIIIYSIKNEKIFKEILKYSEMGKIGGRVSYTRILPIYNFDIIFNKLTNTNYLIISFVFSGSCTSDVKKIKILKFCENKLHPINEIVFAYNSFYNSFILKDYLFLFWEDRYEKKTYLITNVYNKLKFLDIFCREYSFISMDKTKEIPGFEESFGNGGCIINNNKDNEYLYIFGRNKLKDENGILSIIDLKEKQIIKKIEINYIFDFYSCLINFNDKKIIIGDFFSFYIFDIDNNKIISRYSICSNFEKRILSIKTLYNMEYNKYFLTSCGRDNVIRLFY